MYAKSPDRDWTAVGNTVEGFFTHLGRASSFKDTVLPHDLPNRECVPSYNFKAHIWTMSDNPVILKKRTSVQKGALMNQQSTDQESWMAHLDGEFSEC